MGITLPSDGRRTRVPRDRAVEQWLHEQVGPGYDALEADAVRDALLRPTLTCDERKEILQAMYDYFEPSD